MDPYQPPTLISTDLPLIPSAWSALTHPELAMPATGPISVSNTISCCLLLSCLGLAGCYDTKALIEARRAVAVRARLVEVDLGNFRITLPGPYTERKRAEIHFRAFGQVANRDLKLVRATLEKNGPDLQNRMLMVVRKMKLTEIQEPALTTLRTSLAGAINDTLPGDPLQSVGFYSFGFVNL